MISKLLTLFFPKKILDSVKDIDKEVEDILFSLGERLNNKLCLKPEDMYLEEKITNLIRPFLLLDEINFKIFTKYQINFNKKISPYYFEFRSNNHNSPWQLDNKISLGVGNTAFESSLERTYNTMRLVIREEKHSLNSLYINSEHMKDDFVYSNMKSFLESTIEQMNILINSVKNDDNISQEIKDLISTSANFSDEALEKRAIKQEIEAIKKIMPEEIKSKQRFNSLQEKIEIKPYYPKEKVKKI